MSASLNAEQLTFQLANLKVQLQEKNVELLIGTEKVCREFLNLNLPVESEILDVGVGFGVLSASLQTCGFSNIDALDEDLPTLRRLQALRMYRNYIWKDISGLNSTGLREEIYDVILSSEGISSHNLNPSQISEMLRILKPGGHLLFTMNSHETTAERGLFDLNLASFTKEGRCELVKKEKFTDSGACEIGVFYLVRRLPTHLPEYLDKPVSNEIEKTVTQVLVDTSDPETIVKFYDSWSEKYAEDLVLIGNYTGHIKCVEAFLRLNLDHSVQILDLAAGTGLLGAEVIKHGYDNIDGMDSSPGMLAQARKLGIYKNCIQACIGKLGSIPVNRETYDVILMANGFAPGQIYPSSLPEMLRVLRPGGYLLWTMKDGFQLTSPKFAVLDSYIQDLVRQESVQLLVGPVVFQKYLLDHPGRFYMLRKCRTSHWATGSPQGSPGLRRKN